MTSQRLGWVTNRIFSRIFSFSFTFGDHGRARDQPTEGRIKEKKADAQKASGESKVMIG